MATRIKPIAADKILAAMARTYHQRNKVYGNDHIIFGAAMAGLFSKNPPVLETPLDFVKYHWVAMVVSKLSRFVSGGMTHLDSIHDISVYAAMLEDFIRKHNNKKKGKHANKKQSRNK